MRLNKDVHNTLTVGSKVTTDFYRNEEHIVRQILTLYPSDDHASGYVASADGGEICPHCGRAGSPMRPVDAAWFIPVVVPVEEKK